jgi:hypothetical protein
VVWKLLELDVDRVKVSRDGSKSAETLCHFTHWGSTVRTLTGSKKYSSCDTIPLIKMGRAKTKCPIHLFVQFSLGGHFVV